MSKAKASLKTFSIFLIIFCILNLINLSYQSNENQQQQDSESIIKDINLRKRFDFYKKLKKFDTNSLIDLVIEEDEVRLKTKEKINLIKENTPVAIMDLYKDYVFNGCNK